MKMILINHTGQYYLFISRPSCGQEVAAMAADDAMM